MDKSCSRCGAPFSCGSDTSNCWCTSLPPVISIEAGKDCACPDCLAAEASERLKAMATQLSLEAMLVMAAPYRAQPPRQHLDYEMEGGKLVFSAWYHLRRGSCCGNGCRHCPFSHEAV